MMTTFQQKIDALKDELERRALKYGRRKACTLIGFSGKTKEFSQWLRDNYFLTFDDYPVCSLTERKYMDVKIKNIYKQPVYNSCSRLVSGSEGGEIIKTVYTPLFTEKGISYFQRLLQDQNFLHKEVAAIKESHLHKSLIL